MSIELQPLKIADLPPREKAFWQMTGPGAVLVGLSIGAGEIVVWPWITAKFGSTMVWAAVLGIFLQLWVNFEIGRWVICTGESAYTGFARVGRWFAHAFVFFNIAGWLLPGWARVSGTALKAFLLGPDHPSPDWVWVAITFAGVAFLLFGPKQVYAAVEKAISAMVLIVVVGLIIVALNVGTWGAVKDLIGGIFNFPHVTFSEDFKMADFFSALVFAGAGGTANLFYAFYLRDKHIGMGARMEALLNPLRGREEKVSQTGFIFPETEENRRRFRDWFTFVVLDQTLYFWLLNTFTILLFIFGALAVLHPRGIVPAQGRLIWDMAGMLEGTMGVFGRYLFLVIGMATLLSTQITLVDGVARSLSDIFTMNFKFAAKTPASRWYMIVAVFMMVSGTALTAVLEAYQIKDLSFLFNAAYIGGFAMAVYSPLVLVMNLRYLPKSARPGPINIVMVGIASAVYISFAAFSVYSQVLAKFGR